MGTRNGASALSASSECDWIQAHEALSRLSRERAALDVEEGGWLLRAWRSAAHVHLGYGSFAQYIERLFGYKPRTIHEKLRVAKALEALPRLASALAAGALSWCAARELTRVAVPETEPAWLDAARGKTLRELEALVASRAPGDTPDAPATEPPRTRVLRFEVAADTYATFREAILELRRSAGGHLDDDALLLAMARHVLGGPRDDGRSSYQISLSVCAVCGGGVQPTAGELVPVDKAVVAMAACDAQHTGELLPTATALPPANENASLNAVATLRSAEHAHVGANCRRETDVADANDDDANAATNATTTNANAADASDTPPPKQPAGANIRRRPRAKQSVRPALRRAVIARDQRRCRAPGCTHATFMDVHHIQPRSEGGANEASNLLTLCSTHHRAAHRGELLIERDPDGSLTFRHADGAPYGDPTTPRLIDAHAKVFSALRHLGFREGEVKTVLSELRGDAELDAAPVERLLREALCRIKSRPVVAPNARSAASTPSARVVRAE